VDNIDNALRIAWQTRDWELRDRVWTHLWNAAYTKAVKYCRQQLRCDRATAEECASDAFLKAVKEIEKHVRENTDVFKRVESFEPWVTARVMYRCWDAIREERKRNAREAYDRTTDDGRDTVVETLEAGGPSAEDDAIAATSVRNMARELETAREQALVACSFALVDVIDVIRRYLRERFAAASPVHQGQSQAHGPALEELPLDALAGMADLEQFDLEQKDMNMVVMQQLHLSRNEFDQRMKRIRQILRDIRAAA
jgi:DNA-directed RNA polymerase specialized sigma24 family protein